MRLKNLRPLFAGSALTAMAMLGACGESDDEVAENVVPQGDLCAAADLASRLDTVGVLPADHDGGVSDLNLDWTQDEVNVSLCPGTHTLNLAVHNASGHTVGENLWFTVLYYFGHEYAGGHHIEPMGNDVGIGETVPVRFTVDLLPAFASAQRNVRIALIVQTDNPNPNDPVAFFRRIWVNISPGGGCGVPAMEQPAPQRLTIYSYTCGGNTVRLQTNPRLVDGTPTATVVEGGQYMQVTRNAYYEDDLWWADLAVTQTIPNGEKAVVAFGSHEGDRMDFVFGARAECGGDGAFSTGNGGGPPPAGGGDDVSDDDRADDGDNGDDDGEDGDDVSEDPVPVPDGTQGEQTWFRLSPCAAPLAGMTVPFDVEDAAGRLSVTTGDDGGTRLLLRTTGLPAPAPGEEYHIWLAGEQEQGRWRFLSLGRLAAPNGLFEIAVDDEAVVNAQGDPGAVYRVDDEGIRREDEPTDARDALPLSRFDHIFVTIERTGAAADPAGETALTGRGALPDES